MNKVVILVSYLALAFNDLNAADAKNNSGKVLSVLEICATIRSMEDNNYLVNSSDLQMLDKSIRVQTIEKGRKEIPEDEESRLVDNMGKLLLVDKYKINYDSTCELEPMFELQRTVIESYSSLKNKNALIYLERYYLKNHEEYYVARKGFYLRSDVADAIEKLGGKVPEIPYPPDEISKKYYQVSVKEINDLVKLVEDNSYAIKTTDITRIREGLEWQLSKVNRSKISKDDGDLLVTNLGKLLLAEDYKLIYDIAYALDPIWCLKGEICHIYSKLNNKNALKYLLEYYVKEQGRGRFSTDLVRAIIFIGGEVPEIPRKGSVDNIQGLTKEEKKEIINAIKLINEKSDIDALEVFAKYGVKVMNNKVIALLKGSDYLGDSFYYLSLIGGQEVIDFAKSILSKPIPENARLDMEENLCSDKIYAAYAIFKLGGAEDMKILDEHAKMEREFERVKILCKQYVESMKEKFKTAK